MTEPEKKWIKVKAPKKWNPAPGESLEGTYAGAKEKSFEERKFLWHLIRVSEAEVFYVTGSHAEQLFEAVGNLEIGRAIKLVFLGETRTSNDYLMKQFELFITEPERESADQTHKS